MRPEVSIETEVGCLPAGNSGGCHGPQSASETDLQVERMAGPEASGSEQLELPAQHSY